MEMSLEEGKNVKQLQDILREKAAEKANLQSNNSLQLLKKSKFYYSADGTIREHIATYGGYAVLLNSDKLKEELNTKENTMFPTLVKADELHGLKKVNGNIVRKLQPNSLHEFEIMILIQGVIKEIDAFQ